MRKILCIVVLLLFATNCFAVQKVYYDSTTNSTVVDVSGQKSKTQINKEFGNKDWQEITVDENSEAIRVENGKLIKYNYQEENQKIKAEKDKQIKQKEIEIKQKLNLSDKELQDLKEVLR